MMTHAVHDRICFSTQKMPTIQLYKNGEKGPEHIAAEGAIDALEKVSRQGSIKTSLCCLSINLPLGSGAIPQQGVDVGSIMLQA